MASSEPHSATGGDFAAWQRVADELRACQERQQRDWGDIDSADLGQYIAGEADDGVAARIEHAIEELPELRKLTDLVREVLADAGPVAWDQPAPAPSSPRTDGPTLLRFAPPAPRRTGVAGWLRRRSSLVAAACLLIVLGAAMPQMSPLAGPREGALTLTDARSSRGAMVLADAARPAELQQQALPPLTLAPRPAELPGLPPVAFDATKRGFYYLRHEGDLTRAAPPLTRAVTYCQANLKPNDAASTYTVRQLADVYQLALNTDMPAPPAVPAVVAHSRGQPALNAPPPARPDQVRRASAKVMRERIAAKPVREVRTTVTPVLAEALRVAPEPKERLRLVRAIGRLGPAGEPAIPVLTGRLTQTTDAAEAQEVLAVIDQMGPAGRSALPVLAQYTSTAKDRTLSKAPGANQGPVRFTARSEDQRRRAGEVHDRLRGRHGRVGTHDRAGVFTVGAAREATLSFLELARRGVAEVLVETSPGAPPAGGARASRATGRALVVRIYLKGPVVLVEAGDELADGAKLAARAQGSVLGCCQKGQYDTALREVEAMVNPPVKAAQPR